MMDKKTAISKSVLSNNYQHILVGVDLADNGQLAFNAAVSAARVNHATLTIVSILETADISVYTALHADSLTQYRQRLQTTVDRYAQRARQAGAPHVDTVIEEGTPGDIIVNDVIPQVKPDCLMVGAETKCGIARHFGSQAAYMTKYAPITVVVVR